MGYFLVFRAGSDWFVSDLVYLILHPVCSKLTLFLYIESVHNFVFDSVFNFYTLIMGQYDECAYTYMNISLTDFASS